MNKEEKQPVTGAAIRVQLFKTNNVIVKTLTIKHGIYANIFCQKNVSSF